MPGRYPLHGRKEKQMSLNPLALSVKVDDATLHADIRVQNYAVAAAHAAVAILYPDHHTAACPSDYTDATGPANKLVRAMSDVLIQVRRETLKEAAHAIGGIP